MPKQYRVAIAGAGLGGLGMAVRLLLSGEDSFVILERAGGVGGTWRDNTYPGAGCDVPSHLYWYSFDNHRDWSRKFSLQPEIQGNIEQLVERYGLASHIRFHSEVADACWDDVRLVWNIRTSAGDEIAAKVFIAACGQLSRPTLPAIAGRESFAGPSFHSARWRHDVDLAGKRVACIGSGASAVQLIPEIVKHVDHVTVFQRSANYIVPRLDEPYSDEHRRLFRADPQLYQEIRDAIYQDLESRFDALRPGSGKAEEFTGIARAHLEAQVADPALREKLWPDYPLGCKRILVSDDFYPALTRPNVTLETGPIAHIEPAGVKTADGRLCAVDAIVYATGFESHSFVGSLQIAGRGGRTLREAWSGGPEAYLGMTVAGFPNFFLIYGPNTNLGHNSVLTMVEAQYDYVLQALRAIGQQGSALDVRPEVLRQFNRQLQEDLRGSAWAGGCNSWYKTGDGKVTNNWWGNVEEYKRRTACLDLSDYQLLLTASSA